MTSLAALNPQNTAFVFPGQGSQSVGNLESWLADLEGKLRGADAENWSVNAPAAQHIVGNVRLELQTLGQRLQAVREPR